MIELMTVILYSTSLTQRLIGLPMRAIRLNIGAKMRMIICALFRRSGRRTLGM